MNAQRGNAIVALRVLVIVVSLVMAASVGAQAETAVTVLYVDKTVLVERTLEDPTDLWVVPRDLTRINGFELKPEGACIDALCIPINQTDDSDIVITRKGQKWFSLTAFARKLNQAYVVDRAHAIWSFSAVPITRTAFVDYAMAADFELPDRRGRPVRLSDFRGKKVLLLTWASW